jgi:hypothetical protein
LKIEEVARALGITDAVWRKVDVGFGDQQPSSAVPFSTGEPRQKSGKWSKFTKPRDAAPRDEDLLKNAPFAER